MTFSGPTEHLLVGARNEGHETGTVASVASMGADPSGDRRALAGSCDRDPSLVAIPRH
jgi:hypothetical protein